MTPRAHDRGTAAVEAAILAPFLILALLLIVFAGRMAEADTEVRRAASEAARAASLREHPTDAETAAQTTVAANLQDAGVPCATLDIGVDTSAFEAGGQVAVTITCTASMSDVTLLGVPGTRTFTAHAVQVIDSYRGGGQ